MKRSLLILSIVMLLLGTQSLFAQMVLPEPELVEKSDEAVFVSRRPVFDFSEFSDTVSFLWNFGNDSDNVRIEFIPSVTLAAAGSPDLEIPGSIRNNRYFIESVRLTNLAQQSYEEGDYDASTQYSEEAVRYAQLSDEYVRLQLKIKEADDSIAAARKRLDYAASVDAVTRYATAYAQAEAAYAEARTYRAAENWDGAIAAANRVLIYLAGVDSGPAPLPAQYTVRTWANERDCLWNIAGRPWAYNDSRKWKVLYDANRSRMPEPDNPDLIEPGMVVDIPSINGETREGMWDPGMTYQPLP